MNQDIVKGSWLQIKGDVKNFFGKLTDDDMLQIEGNRDKIVGKLQERYGYTRDQAEAEWGKFSRTVEGKFGQIKDATNEAKNTIASKIDDLTSKLK